MTTIEKTFGRDERIIAVAQISKVPVFVWGGIALLLLVLTALCLGGLLLGFTAGLIIAIAVVSVPLIKVFTTELCATDRRIVGKTGLFSVKTIDLPLRQVNSVFTEQNFLGKIMNYSAVRVSTASGTFRCDMVKNAEGFRQMVSERIAACKTGGAASGSEPVHRGSYTCRACGTVLKEGDVFCPECGQAVSKAAEEPEPPRTKTCPHCGATLIYEAVFCGSCGGDTRQKAPAEPVKEEEKPEPRKKKCANCGCLVEEEAVFCPSCGRKTDGSDRESRIKPLRKGFSVPKDLD